MNPTTAQALKRTRANAAVRKAVSRDRCTLCLDPMTSMKLSIEAHRRNLDRSDVVNAILADNLKHIVISVRDHSSDRPSSSVGVSQGEIAAA